MKLYYMKGACSLASYISLNEAGLQFERVEVNHKTHKTNKGVDLITINAKGYVPVLQLDNGEFLTENVAVLLYIADLKPQANLAPPAGTLERYRLVEWLAFIATELHKSFGPLFNPSASEDGRRLALENLHKRLEWLENALGSQPFLMVRGFTVADAYLFVVLSWTKQVGLDLAKWPRLKSHNERVAARPQVRAALKAEGLVH